MSRVTCGGPATYAHTLIVSKLIKGRFTVLIIMYILFKCPRRQMLLHRIRKSFFTIISRNFFLALFFAVSVTISNLLSRLKN